MDMWNEGWTEKLLIIIIITLLILMIPIGIWASIEEHKAWDKFKETHSCKLISISQGYTATGTGVGLMANGQVGTVITSNFVVGQEGWLCDDGITYFRTK